MENPVMLCICACGATQSDAILGKSHLYQSDGKAAPLLDQYELGHLCSCESHSGPKLSVRGFKGLLCLIRLEMLKNNPVVSGTLVL